MLKFTVLYFAFWILVLYLFFSANPQTLGHKTYALDHIPKEYNIPYTVIYKNNVKQWYNFVHHLGSLPQGVGFPLIFKPNTCTSKGNNVEKLYNVTEAVNYINKFPHNEIIIQQFDDSPYEASILYERYPIFKHGKVISIVQKILHDKDAVNYNVTTSHMIDRPDLITPKLNEVIDKISRQIPGFYVGRYDVKFKSINDIMNGKFKVIELNGTMGVDHRAYTKNKRDWSYANIHIQLRWAFKRIIVGILNNLNPATAYKSLTNFSQTIKETRKCDQYLIYELYNFIGFILALYVILLLLFRYNIIKLKFNT